ncbi:hypothetical protein BJX96DRAFT_123186 [Aspergillus floccosus]
MLAAIIGTVTMPPSASGYDRCRLACTQLKGRGVANRLFLPRIHAAWSPPYSMIPCFSTGQCQSECQSRTYRTTCNDRACLPAGIPRIAPRIQPGEIFALARWLSRGWKAVLPRSCKLMLVCQEAFIY